jgi:D-glycero-D-manno-heptose 1,7-bisphosphate phosphatase
MPDIFLDRDGVINYNRTDHVKNWDEFKFLPGSLEALALLHKFSYRVFIITNQAVINRGTISEKVLHEIHQRMAEQVAKAGGWIEKVFYCPHLSEEKCLCRKPQPGLLWQATQEFGATTKGSWLVGDHINDIMAGSLAECRTLLVMSGRGSASYQEFKFSMPTPTTTLNKWSHDMLIAQDLNQAVETILKIDQGLVLATNATTTYPTATHFTFD